MPTLALARGVLRSAECSVNPWSEDTWSRVLVSFATVALAESVELLLERVACSVVEVDVQDLCDTLGCINQCVQVLHLNAFVLLHHCLSVWLFVVCLVVCVILRLIKNSVSIFFKPYILWFQFFFLLYCFDDMYVINPIYTQNSVFVLCT